MAAPVVSLQSVHHGYRRAGRFSKVLQGITLDVREGEFVTVCGESGSGKTTLLNIVAGYLRPTAGRVALRGEDLFAMGDAAASRFRNANLGFIFQQFFLVGYLSCEENILLPAMFSGWSGAKTRARAGELMESLGLLALRDHLPAELSGGQQQRVAVARALLLKPALLLCDEPTGNLDPVNAASVLACLRELSGKERTTVVVVSHEEIVSSASDRVLVLAQGRLDDRAARGN